LLVGNKYEIYETKKILWNHFNIRDINNVDTIIWIKFIKEKNGYKLEKKII